MYLFERGIWEQRTISAEAQARSYEAIEMEFGREIVEDLKKPIEIRPSDLEWDNTSRVSDTPTDADAVYEFNDTYIELRAAWQEEKRGLITFLFLAVGIGLNGYMLADLVSNDLTIMLTGRWPDGNPAPLGMYVVGVLSFLMWGTANYFLWKYFWRWIRLELFTQRHLLARFNRKTRQVHLHRPTYAGGIVTLPWQATMAGIQPKAPDDSAIGECLPLAWPLEKSGAGYDEMAFIGPPMHGNREVVGLWEFIRRYMEEGPQSVPTPKRLRPKFPWPWESVKATLNFMSPVWRSGGQAFAVIVGLLLSPLMLLHAVCHWISLLLCYEPRWPEAIAEAGQPGKPTPKLTTADDFGPEIATNLRCNAQAERKGASRPKAAAKTHERKE